TFSLLLSPSSPLPLRLNHQHRGEFVSAGSGAQLSIRVPAPAIGHTGGIEGEGVPPSGVYPREGLTPLHRDGGLLVPGRTVAQLAVVVLSPAIRRSCRHNSAGMPVPRLDPDDAQAH